MMFSLPVLFCLGIYVAFPVDFAEYVLEFKRQSQYFSACIEKPGKLFLLFYNH